MGGACHRLVLSRQEIPPVVDQIKHLIGITSSVCNPITIPESVKCNIKSLRCAEQAEDIKLHPQDLDQIKSSETPDRWCRPQLRSAPGLQRRWGCGRWSEGHRDRHPGVMRLKWHDKGKIVAGGVEAQATLRRVPRRERRRDNRRRGGWCRHT